MCTGEIYYLALLLNPYSEEGKKHDLTLVWSP